MEDFTTSHNFYDKLYDTAGKPHFAGHLPGLVLFVILQNWDWL